jgi:hypothetical protein
MTTEHPITLPSELFEEWVRLPGSTKQLLETAAQWGADQELEACCDWLRGEGYPGTVIDLRAARRPKPPSLKEEALEELRQFPIDPEGGITSSALDKIRRALEALPND